MDQLAVAVESFETQDALRHKAALEGKSDSAAEFDVRHGTDTTVTHHSYTGDCNHDRFPDTFGNKAKGQYNSYPIDKYREGSMQDGAFVPSKDKSPEPDFLRLLREWKEGGT